MGWEALYTLRRLVLSVYLHIWQHAGDSGIKLTLSLGALPMGIGLEIRRRRLRIMHFLTDSMVVGALPW